MKEKKKFKTCSECLVLPICRNKRKITCTTLGNSLMFSEDKSNEWEELKRNTFGKNRHLAVLGSSDRGMAIITSSEVS
jgi:hypothetical protein